MVTDRTSETTATLERISFESLNARVEAFALDPLAEVLAQLDSEAIVALSAQDPELAARLQALQQRAEELAVDAFSMGTANSVEMALYLLDFSTDRATLRLAADARSGQQLWALGEYLFGRFPDLAEAAGDDERVAGNGELHSVIRMLATGAPRPSDEPLEPVESPPSQDVNLYDTVIVHGTFAKSTTWWREQPGVQNFWAYISQFCPSLFGAGKEFTWSGKNNHSAREQGARDFIDWWNNVGAPAKLQVIAHSHGCNVVYLACTMEPKLNIANMVALGGPVRTWYPPHIASGSRIERLHNVYSRFDVTQVLGSLGGRRGEGRTLGDSTQISNYHTPWEDPRTQLVSVGHSDLHEEPAWRGNGLAKKTLL